MRATALTLLLALLLAGCASETPQGPAPGPTATAVETPAPDPQDEPEPTQTQSDTATSSSASSSTSTTASTSATPAPTPKDADSLVLVAADLGSGWSSDPIEAAPGEAPNQTDDATVYAYRSFGTPDSVESTARVFDTAADARAYFDSAKADLEGAPLQDVDAGDDAFVWKHSPGRWEEGWVLADAVVWDVYVTGQGGVASPSTADLLRKAVANLD